MHTGQRRFGSSHRLLLAAACLLAIVVACTLNPATGQRQLTLIGEQQEIALGRENDQLIEAQMGLYENEELQSYVNELGQRLAALSERPHLPWQFHVMDDPTVNAFALPGGFIYVTRGILAHFNSEAELVSVLGHEIGHVTARHSVEQMSRMQLAQLGLGVAMIASEDARQYAGLASMGLQVLFLKFGRDDETQADELGFRYMHKASYDVHEMPGVFEMLDRHSQLMGGQRLPEWQSTHPNPGNRADHIRQRIANLPPGQHGDIVNRNEYKRRLQDLVYGSDPREGYTIGSTFYHPQMAFRVNFPEGWKIINQKQAVVSVSEEQDAVIVLTIADESNPGQAADAFFSAEGIRRGSSWKNNFHNFSTVPETDPQTGAQQSFHGAVGFVPHDGRVYRLLAYSPSDRWKGYAATGRRAIASFRRLPNGPYLNVKPERLEIVEISSPMTLERFNGRKASNIPIEELAILNGVDPTETMPPGTLVKRVTGGRVPTS